MILGIFIHSKLRKKAKKQKGKLYTTFIAKTGGCANCHRRVQWYETTNIKSEKNLEFDGVPRADLLVIVGVDEVDLEHGQVLQDHILRAERAMEDPLILILLAKAERFPGWGRKKRKSN